MHDGYKVIDVDSHVMEPDDFWQKYIDPEYRSFAPKTTRLSLDQRRFFCRIEVGGHVWFGDTGQDWDTKPFVEDENGGRQTYWDAYADYIQRGFDADSYLLYMDRTGVDAIVLYPTLALHSTAVPNLDPKAAAAIKRAYNNWLYDFCNEGKGRLFGMAALDLRDVDLAAKEARRCVKELGYKGVYVLPDPPIEGVPLDHSYYDPLWSEIEELGVPLGTHEASFHKVGSVGYVGSKHMNNTNIPYAPNGVAFSMGEMMAALSFTGWICARHPRLRVIFNESSTGWGATWFQFWDEKWEYTKLRGGDAIEGYPDHEPSHYFKRQCFITGGLGDPGNRFLMESGMEDNLLVATDFPHPESTEGWRTLQLALGRDDLPLTDQQVKKALSENPQRAFDI